jgi:hypothetical protein
MTGYSPFFSVLFFLVLISSLLFIPFFGLEASIPLMMMMLTTQLAYTPALSASARSQTLQSNIALTTNTPSTAIGLVETDAYEATNPSTPVVGTPQVRSGKPFLTLGMIVIIAATAFVTLLMSNEKFKQFFLGLVKKLTGGNKNQESVASHRNRVAGEITDSLPTKDQLPTLTFPEEAKNEINPFRNHRKPSPTKVPEEVYA